MKTPLSGLQLRTVLSSIIATLSIFWLLPGANAAVKTWDGGGDTSKWQTDANWNADARPVAGDLLVFQGTTRITTTNDFTAGTSFGGITFNGPGAFALNGNSINPG